MKLRIGILLVFVSTLAVAQSGASLRSVAVTGIPDGAVVVSYDLLSTETVTRLVVETRDANGTASFSIFDHVEGEFRARPAAASTLPVRFQEPGRALPVQRAFADLPGTTRFWQIGGQDSPVPNDQFVTAVPLVERRFADVSRLSDPELPPAGAGLTIEYLVADVNRSVISRCTLEPNLIRRSERMTAISAGWIRAQGRPHLLVGIATDGDDRPWPVFYRLYSSSMELVHQTGPVAHIDPNRYPQPVAADLTGDGQDEVIMFSNTRTGPPIVILQPGPGDPAGNRVLALNDCTTRMNGPDVTLLQRELVRRGFSVGTYGIDGWYGPDTRAAVVAFQRNAGLLVSGVVDEATWGELSVGR